MTYEQEAVKIIKKAKEEGEFSYAHQNFDLVVIGFNSYTNQVFVADNGFVELEADIDTESEFFIENYPLVMYELEKQKI